MGRLSVQFLAHKLTIITVPEDKNFEGLEAHIDWKEALETKREKTKELTEVEVNYDDYNPGSSDTQVFKGTKIILEKLKDEWTEDLIRDLASELWWLQALSDLLWMIQRIVLRFVFNQHNRITKKYLKTR